MGNLLSTLVEALKAREVIPFAGTGVSRAVTDDAGRSLFPAWRGLLLAASERLRTEGLAAKAKRVQATLEDSEDPDAYLEAAKVVRDALGALWFPFLKAQFDPPAGRVRPGDSRRGARRLAAGQPTGSDHQLRQSAAVGESARARRAALDCE